MNVYGGTITSWSADTIVSAWSAKGIPLGDIAIQWQEASEGYVGSLYFYEIETRDKECYENFNIQFTIYEDAVIKQSWWLTGVNLLEDKEIIGGESNHQFFAKKLEEL